MKGKSLKSLILDFLRDHEGEWMNGGRLEELAQNYGHKASNGSRRARELHEDGYIERKEECLVGSKVKSVWYKAKMPTKVWRTPEGMIVKKIYE